MCLGEKWVLIVLFELGYGMWGDLLKILWCVMLVFEVEVVEVKK